MELSIYSITFGVLFFWCIGIIQRHVKSGGPNVRSIFMDGIIEVVPGRKEAGMGLCVTRSIYHSLFFFFFFLESALFGDQLCTAIYSKKCWVAGDCQDQLYLTR
jgi:hypothetical protein